MVAGAIMGPGVAAKRMQFRKRVVKKDSRFQEGQRRGSLGLVEGWGTRIMFDFCIS
jgi:hypothetical protein